MQGLGNVQLRLGNYEIALELQLKSLEIAQSMEDIPGLIEATNSIGAIYSNQGNYSQATLYYKESLELAKQINNSAAKAQALNNLGSVAHAQRNFAAAKAYYQQAQAIATATGDLLVEANALAGIGLVEANLKHYSSAIKYQQQSREIAEQIEDRPLQARILNNLGYTLWQANNLEAAVTHLQEAIDLRASLHEELTEDLDRVSLFDTQVRTYNLLQQILVQQQQYPAALAAAEAGRARPFITLLQGDSKPPTIAELQQIAGEQEATLVEYSLIPDPEFIGQGKLKGTHHKLYIWVVQPKGAIAFRQVDLTSLESSLGEIVARSRYAMGIGGRSLTVQFAPPEEQGTTLQELHSILIEPIADLLPANPQQRVIFIPHNELFLVPFPALQNSSGEYLIAQHPIVTAPAIQVLGNTRQQRQAASGKGILIVGNPTMPEIQLQIGQPPQQLDPLPGAEAEAKACCEADRFASARILNGDALIGSRATKNTVLKLLPQARIIHLATHGLLDEIQGLKIPGAIALTPEGDDDGILTAAEILELELSPELVVLSACNTGKGEIVGDGVLGLSRSLIAAGTPSAIVSLWAVPDAPTAQLMTAFYRNWQSEPDKAQALRQAMLTTMKTHPNPRDWAAFTLIGEAN